MDLRYTRRREGLNELAGRQLEVKEPLGVTRVDDGVILPWLAGRADGNLSVGLGGVIDGEGRFVSESGYDGGWLVNGGAYEYSTDAVETSGERVIYFGPFFSHWGHFLVDLANRLWVVGRRAELKGWKIAYTSMDGRRIDGVFLEFFELLGVLAEDLIRVDSPTRFRTVVIPEPAHVANRYYSREFAEMFLRVTRNACAGLEAGLLRSIYFTRTRFFGAAGKESGELAIQDVSAETASRSFLRRHFPWRSRSGS